MVLGLNVDVMIEVASRACMQYRDNQNASSPDDHMLLLSVAATSTSSGRSLTVAGLRGCLRPVDASRSWIRAWWRAPCRGDGPAKVGRAGGPISVPLGWAPSWRSAQCHHAANI